MNPIHFLPYYLTLFTLSAGHEWPAGLSFLEQKNFETMMASFTAAQVQRFMAFSQGLKAYFEAPRFPPPAVRAVHPQGKPVFIIPSLVTPPALLHLTSDHSFLNFLSQNGMDPLVMQWPSVSWGSGSFEDFEKACLQTYLKVYTSSPPPLVIGIREGIFFALSLVRHAVPLAGLVLMDEPQGNFDETLLLREILSPFILSFLNGAGAIPPPLTRLFFSLGQREKVIQKIISFKKLATPNLFTSVEDCLNQLLACPAFLAKCYLAGDFSDLYPKKEIAEKLQTIPTLLIQPREKSLTFLDRISFSSQILRPPLGSFGLLASSFAPLHVWTHLVKWLQKTKIGMLKCQVLQSSQEGQEE